MIVEATEIAEMEEIYALESTLSFETKETTRLKKMHVEASIIKISGDGVEMEDFFNIGYFCS